MFYSEHLAEIHCRSTIFLIKRNDLFKDLGFFQLWITQTDTSHEGWHLTHEVSSILLFSNYYFRILYDPFLIIYNINIDSHTLQKSSHIQIFCVTQ